MNVIFPDRSSVCLLSILLFFSYTLQSFDICYLDSFLHSSITAPVLCTDHESTRRIDMQSRDNTSAMTRNNQERYGRACIFHISELKVKTKKHSSDRTDRATSTGELECTCCCHQQTNRHPCTKEMRMVPSMEASRKVVDEVWGRLPVDRGSGWSSIDKSGCGCPPASSISVSSCSSDCCKPVAIAFANSSSSSKALLLLLLSALMLSSPKREPLSSPNKDPSGEPAASSVPF
ncbi:hypothetical protein KCU91_g3, partial [Aureobasidium melanogenum]